MIQGIITIELECFKEHWVVRYEGFVFFVSMILTSFIVIHKAMTKRKTI